MRRAGLLLLILLSACAPVVPTPIPSLTGTADQAVLRVRTLPGFLPPGAKFVPPRVAVYVDGEMIVDGERRRKLNQEGMRKLLREAVDAGLGERMDYGSPQIPDAPVTTITFAYGGDPTVSRIVALDVSDTPGLTGEQQAAREKVRAFINRYTKLDGLPDSDFQDAAEPYQSQKRAVYAFPQEGAVAEKEWPLADLAQAGNAYDFGRCQILDSSQLGEIGTSKAPQLWRSGAAVYQVTVRPLLPDEPDCAALE